MLYDRDYTITVDTIQITKLRCTFSVKKTLKKAANTVDLKVYNLNSTHRSQLESLASATVQIEAGYVNATSTIFLGDLRTHNTVREGADLVTVLSCGDGEKALQTKRASLSLAKGSTTTQVLQALVAALGVDPGNSAAAIAKLAALGNPFTMGTVLSGNAAREMTRVLKAYNYTWSIQDGKLQILAINEALVGTALLLTAQTGLVGSPTVDKDGMLSAKCLMIADVTPGRLMVLTSESLSGQFRIVETGHTGDTHSGDWTIELKAKRY